MYVVCHVHFCKVFVWFMENKIWDNKILYKKIWDKKIWDKKKTNNKNVNMIELIKKFKIKNNSQLYNL